MRPETYHMLAGRQRDYWWHRARRAMSLAMLRRHGVAPDPRWLDIGCGPGGNLNMLASLAPELVVGIDLSPLALDFARQEAPEAGLARCDITQGLPFRDAAFDVTTIFNVLYHDWVASDVGVLREMRRVLRAGGLALITEPAFPALAREMDEAAMANRRYRLAEFREMCGAASLEIILVSYFTSFGAAYLLGMKGARKLMSRRTAIAPDMKPLSPAFNDLLYRVAMIEAQAIARGLPVPFGTTLVCLARKPAE